MFSETPTWNAHRASQNLARLLGSTQSPSLVSAAFICLNDNFCPVRFWLRAIKVASESAQRRFIESFSAYVYAVIDEASDRTRGHVRGIADFLELQLRFGFYLTRIYTRITMSKLRDTVATISSPS